METCNYTKIYLLALPLFVQLKLIDLIASHFLVVFVWNSRSDWDLGIGDRG